MDPNLSYPWKQERICFVPTRITDHGSRITDHGSRITDHGSRITDHGSRITDHGSRITDHGSRITDQRINGSIRILRKLLGANGFDRAASTSGCEPRLVSWPR